MTRARRVRRAVVAAIIAAGAVAGAARRANASAVGAGTPEATAAPEKTRSSAEETTISEWRARRLSRLTAPDGWLTLVGLEWLNAGINGLGSAADADVRFPSKAPARLATITREGRKLTLEAAAGVTLTIDGKPVLAATPLASDHDGEPTVVALGSISFFVIERDERWAVRIKDSESPVRTTFSGLDYYPIRDDWRITARFEPAASGATIAVPSVLGSEEESASPGSVVFERDGHLVRLLAIDEGDGRLFLVFGDQTNGNGTYGGGRFVYADPPKPGEQTVTVDFNEAYNPPCVFTPYATCPLPPKGNRLPFAIEAGEKLWSGYHHVE